MSRLLKPLFLILVASASLPVLADTMGGMGNMDMNSMSAAPAAKTAHGLGIIKALDAKAGTITLSHRPIKELSWPAMTMSFKVAKPELLTGVRVGDKVHFSLQGHDMDQMVTAIAKQ